MIGSITSATVAGHAEADYAEAGCPPDSAAACFCSQTVIQAVSGEHGVEDAEMKPWLLAFVLLQRKRSRDPSAALAEDQPTRAELDDATEPGPGAAGAEGYQATHEIESPHPSRGAVELPLVAEKGAHELPERSEPAHELASTATYFVLMHLRKQLTQQALQSSAPLATAKHFAWICSSNLLYRLPSLYES